MKSRIGVLGGGSFGTTISKLLAYNHDVLWYLRNNDHVRQINETHEFRGYPISERILATSDIEKIGRECTLIMPVIPSENFRDVMKQICPYITPEHIMIHCTKGLDILPIAIHAREIQEIKDTVFTMTEVIMQETNAIRTGCIAGPNLAREILEGQPAAAVVASEFDEVIEIGRKALSSPKFIVFGSYNLKGIELAGALKNIIAISSGILGGLGFGKNMEALLLTRGLREMIHIAKAVGSEIRPFFGTAGVGDLIATATSSKSRNYTFGQYIASGLTVDQIKDEMDEVAEGYRTIRIAHRIVEAAELKSPIVKTLYQITYENKNVRQAVEELIGNPLAEDVDFI